MTVTSNFVWNIEIITEDNEQMDNIYKDLVNNGLSIGKLKSQINTKEIINKVRLNRNDIAWMGIERTNAIVKLVKATAKPERVDENDYCSIVSDKQGVITKINAQNGTIAAKAGGNRHGKTSVSLCRQPGFRPCCAGGRGRPAGILQRAGRWGPEPLPGATAPDQSRVQPAGSLPDAPPGRGLPLYKGRDRPAVRPDPNIESRRCGRLCHRCAGR